MQPKFTLHEVVTEKGNSFIFLRKDGIFVDCALFEPDKDGDKLDAIKRMVDLADKIRIAGDRKETLIAEL
jgi:hypothetical protein